MAGPRVNHAAMGAPARPGAVLIVNQPGNPLPAPTCKEAEPVCSMWTTQ